MSSNLKAFVLILVITGCFQQIAFAGNWEWGSRFSGSANWNDNPALADDSRDPESTFRMVGIYIGRFERLASNNNFRIEPRITRDYYPDKKFKDLESTDIFLPGNFSYNRPRSGYNLGFNASQQSVLSDEATLAEDNGANQLNADDTVYRYNLSPSFNLSITEKDQFSLGVSLGQTDYKLDYTNRSDQTIGFLFFSYSRTLTERQTLGFSGNLAQSKAERINFAFQNPFFCIALTPIANCTIKTDSSSDNFTLDYGYRWSPKTRLVAKVGLQKTDTETSGTAEDTGIQSSSNTFSFESTTYDIGIQRINEKGQYDIFISRKIQPNTNGQPQDRYEIRFIGDSDLTQKLSFDWNFLLWQQQAVAIAAINDELDRAINLKNLFFSGALRLNWKLTRKWGLSGSYRYRQREREQALSDEPRNKATSNQVFFSVSYAWKSIQR
jgi:hypothetical protein